LTLYLIAVVAVSRARFGGVERMAAIYFGAFARAFERLVARARRRVVLCGDVAPRAGGSGTAATALRDAAMRARDAMPAVADDALPEDAREALDEFEAATEAIERALEPFLDADRKALTKELRPLERAEVHCEAARAIVALAARRIAASSVVGRTVRRARACTSYDGVIHDSSLSVCVPIIPHRSSFESTCGVFVYHPPLFLCIPHGFQNQHTTRSTIPPRARRAESTTTRPRAMASPHLTRTNHVRQRTRSRNL